MAKAESEKRSETVAGRVTPTQLARLRAIADADERTLSFVVEKAVDEYLSRHSGKPPAARRR